MVMPYRTAEDLPDQVRNHLPPHAQEIFVAAFNDAFNKYKDPKQRRDAGEDLEEIAFKVAWSAVKKEYHKEGSIWVRKQ
jgi:cation transport regulator